MADTPTPNFGFHKPAKGDRDWDVALNANADLSDTTLKAHQDRLDAIEAEQAAGAIPDWVPETTYPLAGTLVMHDFTTWKATQNNAVNYFTTPRVEPAEGPYVTALMGHGLIEFTWKDLVWPGTIAGGGSPDSILISVLVDGQGSPVEFMVEKDGNLDGATARIPTSPNLPADNWATATIAMYDSVGEVASAVAGEFMTIRLWLVNPAPENKALRYWNVDWAKQDESDQIDARVIDRTLSRVSDAIVEAPQAGDILIRKDGIWQNVSLAQAITDAGVSTASSLAELTDLTLTAVQDGDVIKRVGGQWVNAPDEAGTGGGSGGGSSAATYSNRDTALSKNETLAVTHPADASHQRVVEAFRYLADVPVVHSGLDFDAADAAGFILEDADKLSISQGLVSLGNSPAFNKIIGNMVASTSADAAWVTHRFSTPVQAIAVRFVFYDGLVTMGLKELEFYNGATKLTGITGSNKSTHGNASYVPSKAFDGNLGTVWLSGAAIPTLEAPDFFMGKLASAQTLTHIRFLGPGSLFPNRHPYTYEIQYTADTTAVVTDPFNSPKWSRVSIYNGTAEGTETAMDAETAGNVIAPSASQASTFPNDKAYYVTTGADSQVATSHWTAVRSISLVASIPAGTDVRTLVSFDGRTTWKAWDGSAWTAVTLANIATSGMTKAALEALTGSEWSAAGGFTPGTLDFAFSLSTTDASKTPSVDQVTIHASQAGGWRQLAGSDVLIDLQDTVTYVTNLLNETIDMKAVVHLGMPGPGSETGTPVQATLVPTRQTALTGRTDVNGQANFLEAAGGLVVDLKATFKPLMLAFAAGFDEERGAIDFVKRIDTDVPAAWTVPPNATTYLYIDLDDNGAPTFGLTQSQPLYQQQEPAAVSGVKFHPNMTADNVPSPYAASGSTTRNSTFHYHAFDGSYATHFSTAANAGALLALDMGSERTVAGYAITPYISDRNYAPVSWVIEGSVDGVNGWTAVDTRTSSQPAVRTVYTLPAAASYRHFRIRSTAASSTFGTAIMELEFFANSPEGINWFNPIDMVMNVGIATGWVQKKRLFVGEAVTDATSVVSLVTYALQGRYDSGWFTIASNTNYTKNHNIGTPIPKIVYFYSLTGDDADAAMAHDVFPPEGSGAGYYGHYVIENLAVNSRLVTKFGFRSSTQSYRGSARTTGSYRIKAERGW